LAVSKRASICQPGENLKKANSIKPLYLFLLIKIFYLEK